MYCKLHMEMLGTDDSDCPNINVNKHDFDTSIPRKNKWKIKLANPCYDLFL